jgi:hypothetical protein
VQKSSSKTPAKLNLYLCDVSFELRRRLKGPHVLALHPSAAWGAWHFSPHGYSPFIGTSCQKTYGENKVCTLIGSKRGFKREWWRLFSFVPPYPELHWCWASLGSFCPWVCLHARAHTLTHRGNRHQCPYSLSLFWPNPLTNMWNNKALLPLAHPWITILK